jgi:hypothetical protein
MAASCIDRQKASNLGIDFDLAGAMKTFDSFESWYKDQTPKHKRVIARLRHLVSDVAPKLLDTSKWTNGIWQKGDLPPIFIHIEPDHVQFGFFGGASLNDPMKLLKGKGNTFATFEWRRSRMSMKWLLRQ